MIIFYVLAPLPLLIARNMESESGLEMASKFIFSRFFSVDFLVFSLKFFDKFYFQFSFQLVLSFRPLPYQLFWPIAMLFRYF